MVKVRRATEEELPAIREMDKVCFAHDTLDAREEDLWWLATTPRRIMGYIGLRLVNCDWAGYVFRVGVLPKYRGRKLHTAMLKEVEKYARQKGLLFLSTYVHCHNVPSANNFIRAGWLLDWPNVAVEGPWLILKKKLVA